MFDPKIFAQGVYGVLQIDWLLRCETPLALRNGLTLAYTESKRGKERGQGLNLLWREKRNNNEHEVSALHYGPKVQGDQVRFIHFVPGSSVRGALRNWIARHLVQKEMVAALKPPPQKEETDEEETETFLEVLDKALDTGYKSIELVFSLFGQTADSRTEGERRLEANAGRLRVDVQPFAGANLRGIDSSGSSMTVQEGPDNAARHMTVRSPIDRITHAAKESGLHHFLEFSKGETFRVRLSISNPTPQDLGMISLWRREMNDGLLRFGALSSVGRGRVSVQEEAYDLWLGPQARVFADAEGLQAVDDDEDDALAGLWQHYTLSGEKLSSFEKSLEKFLTGGHDGAQS